MQNHNQKVNLIWNIAEHLRGSWKQHEYADVVLPLAVLKRLDSVLAPTKQKVLDRYADFSGQVDVDPILKSISGVGFYNTSPYDFQKLLEEPSQVARNFKTYLNSYSPNIRDIFEKFEFNNHLDRLEGGDLLYLILTEFNKVDLHPDVIDNHAMGSIFEELLRRFSEMSNETAGEHYTPRDVVRLMAQLMVEPDRQSFTESAHKITTIYDGASGTGGMLTLSKDYILENINPNADVYLFGQELNPVTFAMCKSDMLIRGEDPNNIRGGEKDHSKASTLSNDQFFGQTFSYTISNPPYGVDWKKDKSAVEKEYKRGYAGRFGAGLPRVSDGQLLFLQHMISKMQPEQEGGARTAIIMNGSPLFTGDAGSGESEIRRWVMEKDLVEAIIALPDQMFYNTGIGTYIWILSNRKPAERKGKVQLIDARELYAKTRKSLGQKRKTIEDTRDEILKLYMDFKEGELVKIFNTIDFAFRQITIERPLKLDFKINEERLARLKANKVFAEDNPSKKKGEKREEENKVWQELRSGIYETLESSRDKEWQSREVFLKDLTSAFKAHKLSVPARFIKIIWQELGERNEEAEICLDSKGNPEPDTELRDTENVPFGKDIYEYFAEEVKPYAADAWIDESKRDEQDGEVGRVGYEIPFTRYFYTYEPPRSVEEIEKDIVEVENELLELLKKL